MDVYLSLQFGNTALSKARANNHNDVVQYLLQRKPKWKIDTLYSTVIASTYVVITLYNFYIRILTLYSCLDCLKYYHFITFLIQSLYLFMSHERTCCQWLILSQEHGSKFNISLSSQKEIQLEEISVCSYKLKHIQRLYNVFPCL